MKTLLRYSMIGLIAAAAAMAGYFTSVSLRGNAAANAASTIPPGTNETLLGLTLPDLDGTEQTLAQWRGKILVVNFWATWCPPCIKEIPEFSAVSRRHADAPVQFVGISIDTADNVREFNTRFDIPYPLLIGSMQTLAVATELGNSVRALPFTVILDRHGDIRHVTLGTLSEAELEGKIEDLLKD